MAETYVQHRRSTVASQEPTGLEVGEFAINLPDQKIFYGNTAGVVDVLAVRNHSDQSHYSVGELVAYKQDIYRCTSTHTAEPFNLSNFTSITASVAQGSRFNYLWGSVGAVPATGEMTASQAPGVGGAVTISIHKTTYYGLDVGSVLVGIEDGDFIGFLDEVNSFGVAYQVTARPIDQGDYFTVATVESGNQGTIATGTQGTFAFYQTPQSRIPSGGNAGDLLTKVDAQNYNTQWSPPTAFNQTIVAGAGLTGGGNGQTVNIDIVPVPNGGIAVTPTAIQVNRTTTDTWYADISHIGTNDEHPLSTQTAAGFMSAADKLKLDNIAGTLVSSFNTRTGAVVSVAGDYNAGQITVDNQNFTVLTAVEAQAAFEEIDAALDTIGTTPKVDSFRAYNPLATPRTGAVVASASDYTAGLIDFDPTNTTIVTATDVQDAIEELDAEVAAPKVNSFRAYGPLATPRTGAIVASASDYNAGQVDFDATALPTITATNVQDAIAELDGYVQSLQGDLKFFGVLGFNDPDPTPSATTFADYYIFNSAGTRPAGDYIGPVDIGDWFVYDRGATQWVLLPYGLKTVIAANVGLDPTGLTHITATNVQAGMAQLDTAIDLPKVNSFKTRTGAVVPADADYTAAQTTFDPAGLNYISATSTRVQAAIAELDGAVFATTGVTSFRAYNPLATPRTGAIVASASDYEASQIDLDDTTLPNITATDVQTAFEQIELLISAVQGNIRFRGVLAFDDPDPTPPPAGTFADFYIFNSAGTRPVGDATGAVVNIGDYLMWNEAGGVWTFIGYSQKNVIAADVSFDNTASAIPPIQVQGALDNALGRVAANELAIGNILSMPAGGAPGDVIIKDTAAAGAASWSNTISGGTF